MLKIWINQNVWDFYKLGGEGKKKEETKLIHLNQEYQLNVSQ